MERVNLYTDPSATEFFREKVVKLRDLSPQKILLHLQEFLYHSEEKELFRLEWREKDELDPDDVGVYQKLSLPCVRFLKQKYLVFPTQAEGDNLWISELCNADSGDIELDEIKITSEDPGSSIHLDRILYASGTSRFICVLSNGDPATETNLEDPAADLLSRRVTALIRDTEKNYIVIDLEPTEDEAVREAQRQGLRGFGVYLKTISF